MLQHVMIDLETMGLRPNSAIVSIGAVHFDSENAISTFHSPVSLQSCLDVGLTTDQSTMDWWMTQSTEARSSWQRDDAPPLINALTEFSHWLDSFSSLRTRCVWGNGVDFDMVLTTSAYRAVSSDSPWLYYNQRCYRTIRSMFHVAELPRNGVHHNAADDALHQVRVLQSICRTYRIAL